MRVKRDHPRNHDGDFFSVLVTRTTATPRPGSADITRACEEGWVGMNGYVRPDGTRQRCALAFQGHVRTAAGETLTVVFLADLPDDLTLPADGPLAGTETRRPFPPRRHPATAHIHRRPEVPRRAGAAALVAQLPRRRADRVSDEG